jgi:hypothetical protein
MAPVLKESRRAVIKTDSTAIAAKPAAPIKHAVPAREAGGNVGAGDLWAITVGEESLRKTLDLGRLVPRFPIRYLRHASAPLEWSTVLICNGHRAPG